MYCLARALHALRLSASADDGKRLGACGKRLRVALNSTKWILEGGAGGRTVPRAHASLAPREMTESGLERSGKRLRVALHSTKWILEGGAGGRPVPRP